MGLKIEKLNKNVKRHVNTPATCDFNYLKNYQITLSLALSLSIYSLSRIGGECELVIYRLEKSLNECILSIQNNYLQGFIVPINDDKVYKIKMHK